MHLTKHHGLGNDFLVLLAPAGSVPRADADLARRLCDRHRGVGADGFLVGEWGRGSGLTMTLFNADGSCAEVSGNGLRCLAQAEARRRGQTTLDLVIDTAAGARRCSVRPGGNGECDDPAQVSVSVDLGPVKVALVEEAGAAKAASVNVGNPHLVLLDHPGTTLDLAAEGRRRPDLNVEIVRSIAGQEVRMEVWERGVGRTEACGSGAVAVAGATAAWGLTDSAVAAVTVVMPGGPVTVALGEPGESAELTGPAVFIADIEVEVN